MDTQNPTPAAHPTTPVATPSPYAGFWLRVVAAIIDGILLNVVSLILSPGGMHGYGGYYGHHGNPGFSFATAGVAWLYFSLMESSVWQGTVGKKILNIKVTDLNGNRITFARATGRYFSKFISGIILMIGFIMAAFTEKKQALHDIIAKTLVIRR